ncbi:MAG: radical SAM protein [Nitriliruptorales bacterium]|nr:radical SAM protein [Nitriliruptorales bacterium]
MAPARVLEMLRVTEVARRVWTGWSDTIHSLPIVILFPHSGCNCRCVMCDIWQANAERRQLTVDELRPHVSALERLGTRRIVLSGGEALLHDNLWELCRLLRIAGARITLLSTGLSLQRHADEVVAWIDDVIVSLDGPREVHDEIRRVPRAFDRLADGVAALKERRAEISVTGRCVVQRRNHRALLETVEAARSIGLQGISFLAADVTSSAFNRPDGWPQERQADVAVTGDELATLRASVEAVIQLLPDLPPGYVAESPEKLRRLVQHFEALASGGGFPVSRCNAPWVSTVVEADGTVRPCFFHAPLGNIHERPLDEILNSDAAVSFRRELNVASDPTCSRCTCTLYLAPRAQV